MTFSVDSYLGRQYDQSKYNCWHFVCDVWKDLTNVELVPDNMSPWQLDHLHGLVVKRAQQLQRLPSAESPCLVLMLRKRIAPHIGVFHNGRVLHLNSRGAAYAPLHHATAGFPTVEYYK
jgi:hypothetical protein